MFSFNQVDAIVFDLDETLVHSSLDFEKIKQVLGCPCSEDILAYINAIDCDNERAFAHNLVLQHELEDAKRSTMIDGAREFIEQAESRKLPLAIVTRNCRAASQIKLSIHDISIEILITREDALPKPNPEALLMVANRWQLETNKIAYIGDYKYDIEAAHNANMQAWLYQHSLEKPKYADRLIYIPKSADYNNIL